MREMNPTPPSATRHAVLACARWMHYCLTIGWKKSDLDFLQSLWWQYHDWEGRLTCQK